MKKRIIYLTLTASLVAALTTTQLTSSYAATSTKNIDQQIANLKKQKADSQKTIKDAQNKIAQVKSDKQLTLREIDDLNNQLKATYAKLEQLDAELDKTEKELENQAKQLDEAETRVAKRDDLLKSRLRLIYTNGAVSYLDVLFNATSFSDFLTRLDSLQMVFNQDQEILDENKKDRDAIALKKEEVAKSLVEVQKLYDTTTALRVDLQQKEHAKEVRVAELEHQAESLEKITAEEEEKVITMAREESKLQAEKAKAAGGSSYKYSGGKFAYPLPSQVPVTSEYGSRVNPVTGQKGEFHKGIDFGAKSGTNILAAEDGVVLLASSYSGYGNCVIINHGKDKNGNEVWTLYGHIRMGGIKVSKGDKVKRGQKIAEVGSTGQSTGPHLHFEVRVNEKVVDPGPYLK
ncbi:peptidase M23 [Paenibacillus albiflavus]|uniref:Peptidase M23 n=1 Tax=Paenibacillus albiflavus TaxID=2545760 RepID=A0A4R4ECI7_9BACL|nr:M23 family metallopeptidase [Paenibacillus albiflavus]TCZ76873.1 peptidase M23 [Paenibacillus albiflavus]